MARMLLDAGAVLALARGHAAARANLLRAGRAGIPVWVPIVVVPQVHRGGAGDAPVNRALKLINAFLPPTLASAQLAGSLLARTRTRDVVDALVAAEALLQPPAVILTSDSADLQRLIAAHADSSRVRVISV